MSRMIRQLPDLLVEPVVRASLAEDLGRAGDGTAPASTASATHARRTACRRAARGTARVRGQSLPAALE